MIALKSLLVWFGILALAITNGIIREIVLLPAFGAPAAFILSGLLLSILIIGVAYLALPWLRLNQASKQWAVGFGWLALTLVFEFSFGLAQGKSWPVLLEAYTFKDGNIWSVVLTITACAPLIAAKLRTG
ncbi:MAG: hypothetical protein ABR522_02095 [Marinobacter sp.]